MKHINDVKSRIAVTAYNYRVVMVICLFMVSVTGMAGVQAAADQPSSLSVYELYKHESGITAVMTKARVYSDKIEEQLSPGKFQANLRLFDATLLATIPAESNDATTQEMEQKALLWTEPVEVAVSDGGTFTISFAVKGKTPAEETQFPATLPELVFIVLESLAENVKFNYGKTVAALTLEPPKTKMPTVRTMTGFFPSSLPLTPGNVAAKIYFYTTELTGDKLLKEIDRLNTGAPSQSLELYWEEGEVAITVGASTERGLPYVMALGKTEFDQKQLIVDKAFGTKVMKIDFPGIKLPHFTTVKTADLPLDPGLAPPSFTRDNIGHSRSLWCNWFRAKYGFEPEYTQIPIFVTQSDAMEMQGFSSVPIAQLIQPGFQFGLDGDSNATPFLMFQITRRTYKRPVIIVSDHATDDLYGQQDPFGTPMVLGPKQIRTHWNELNEFSHDPVRPPTIKETIRQSISSLSQMGWVFGFSTADIMDKTSAHQAYFVGMNYQLTPYAGIQFGGALYGDKIQIHPSAGMSLDLSVLSSLFTQ